MSQQQQRNIFENTTKEEALLVAKSVPPGHTEALISVVKEGEGPQFHPRIFVYQKETHTDAVSEQEFSCWKFVQCVPAVSYRVPGPPTLPLPQPSDIGAN